MKGGVQCACVCVCVCVCKIQTTQTHSHKVKQREHGNPKVPPVPLISTRIITKEVVAHDSKEKHQNEQEEEEVEHRAAEGV